MAKPRWHKSDRPSDSEHIDFGTCGGRVMPHRDGSGWWEWSSWLGPSGRRVLHGQQIVKTKSAAKRAAAASCKRLVGSG